MITRAFRPDMPAHVGAAEDSLGALGMNDEQGATPPGRDAAQSDSGRDGYDAAIGTLFDNNRAVREALRHNLGDRSQEALRLRDRADELFAGFTASKYTAEERARPTYLAPGDSLAELLDQAVQRGLDTHRGTHQPGQLRLHLTEQLLAKVDTSDPTDERLGRIRLADLVALASGPGVLVPPLDPAALCRAEQEADRLLDAIGTVTPSSDGNGLDRADSANGLFPAAVPATIPPTDHTGEEPDGRVVAKVEDLIATMDAPESPLRFEVGLRSDPGTVRSDISTFELRSGPSDVTAYHDFTSLRVAFEDVWSEVFDGHLAALGRQLYQECVKLEMFAGLDPSDRAIETLDDLRRLMAHIRDLADITIDATPGEVRAQATGTGGATTGASQGTLLADAVVTLLDPAGAITKGIGDKTVEAILNPAGAVVEAIRNLFAGKPQLTWESFPGPLPVAGDVITVRFEPDAVPPGTIEIVLTNSPQAWWWKGIQFREFGPDGAVVADFLISNDPQDSGVWDPGSHNRLPLYTTQLPNGLLEFQKAAPGIGFGIHTGYYLLADLPGRLVDRTRATFTWEKDS
jgi:hypothetical protein